MNPRTRHWLLPLAGAAGLHAAVALAWLGTRAPAPELGGAATEGIHVSLALAGAEAQTAPIEATPEPAPQPAAPPPPPPPAAKPKPAPKPLARPVPAAVPIEPVATLPSEPAPTASANTAEAPMPEPAVSFASAAPRSGGQAGGQAGGNAGARSRFNGKPARNVRGYFGQISAWIDANKDYPTEVKKKKQQGTVVVRFTIGRDGQLLASTIKQSSGHVLLDQAALETLARAAPFPPIPEFVGRETLSIAVPIDYTLITD